MRYAHQGARVSGGVAVAVVDVFACLRPQLEHTRTRRPRPSRPRVVAPLPQFAHLVAVGVAFMAVIVPERGFGS